jgi:hypothetical protein
MSISAMKQALEAWQTSVYGSESHHKAMLLALENVRGYDVENLYGLDDEIDALRTAIEAETAQGQEPFCYHDGRNIVGKEFADHSDVFPLYTTPPAAQRQWVGLTDEDIFSVLGNLQKRYNGPPTEDSRVVFALAIEAKLRKKNGGAA